MQNDAAPAGTLDRIYPGLLVNDPTRGKSEKKVVPQKPAVLQQQLRIVQQHGYRGFCLFAYDYLSDENIAVVRSFSQ